MTPRKTAAKKAAPRKKAPAKKVADGQHPGVPPIPDAVPGAEERAALPPHRLVDDEIAAERDAATANRPPVPADERAS